MCIFRKQAAVQVIQHILRTLIAQLAIFHGCLDDDVLHGLRQCRIEITNTWYLLTQMLHCNLDGVVSMEGNIPGQKLIKHDTKRIDVHLIAWCFSPCCFRSQIVRTAQYRITLRQLYRIVRQRNSEIGNLYRTIILNQNILRLDIPVNNIVFMRMLYGAGQLNHDVYSLFLMQCPTLGNQLLQCTAAYIFHYDIVTSLKLSDIVYIHYIGMVQLADCIGLPLKAQQCHRILAELPTQHLDRHLTVQYGIDRQIDIRHTAFPQ